MSPRNELIARLLFVSVMVVLIAVMIVFAGLKINLIEGPALKNERETLFTSLVEVKADRGDILAADGSLLATSLPFFEIRFDTKASVHLRENFSKNVDSLAHCLAYNLNGLGSKAQIKADLMKAFNNGDRYHQVAKKLNFSDVQKIKKFPIFREGQNKGGLIVIKHDSRVHPFKHLALRTLGVKRENAASVGLEDYFDEKLSGESGLRLMEKIPGNIQLPRNDFMEIEPKSGMDIVTTLDVNVQDIVHDALLKRLQHHKADHGCVIVMEVETGAIRAMANLGLSKDKLGYQENFNYAIAESTEPGSTFKLASFMALLEDGKIKLQDTINLNKGKKTFYGHVMRDSEEHNITYTQPAHAFAVSSNVGIAELVTNAYGEGKEAAKFVKRIKQFGLGEKTHIQLHGEPLPVIKEAFDKDAGWSLLSLPWMSIGYETSMTPLQILTFYNSIANGGKRMKPYLVSEIKHQGEVKIKYPPTVEKRKIASTATIQQAQQLLELVMVKGTGTSLKIKNIKTAGKTGTTVLNYGKGELERKKYQSSFVGYFPAESPKYSVIVVVNNPTQNGYYGASVAGEVFKEIVEKMMLIKEELHPIFAKGNREESGESLLPVRLAGYSKDFQRIAKSLHISMDKEAHNLDWAKVEIQEGRKALFAGKNIQHGLVPDVRGMGLRDAIYLLENNGLSVSHTGVGRVVNQSLPPGTAAKSKHITLTLK
jgi:cell division protein FtsI (penicillin-binding protein 3)